MNSALEEALTFRKVFCLRQLAIKMKRKLRRTHISELSALATLTLFGLVMCYGIWLLHDLKSNRKTDDDTKTQSISTKITENKALEVTPATQFGKLPKGVIFQRQTSRKENEIFTHQYKKKFKTYAQKNNKMILEERKFEENFKLDKKPQVEMVHTNASIKFTKAVRAQQIIKQNYSSLFPTKQLKPKRVFEEVIKFTEKIESIGEQINDNSFANSSEFLATESIGLLSDTTEAVTTHSTQSGENSYSHTPTQDFSSSPMFTVSVSGDITFTTSDKNVDKSNIRKNAEGNNSQGYTLADIHITVKASQLKLERIYLLLKTWIKHAKEETYVITDVTDERLQSELGDHLVVCNCRSQQLRRELCCKTGEEFDSFIDKKKQWWCHFDDDVYLNTKALIKLLSLYNSKDYVYLGKQSRRNGFQARYGKRNTWFHFHNGAGYCLSKPLVKLLRPWIGDTKMADSCDKFNLDDDALIGFLITDRIKIPLRESRLFHSQFEDLSKTLKDVDLFQQVTFSYYGENITPLGGKYFQTFSKVEDPTRFLSIHCLLFPKDKLCSKG